MQKNIKLTTPLYVGSSIQVLFFDSPDDYNKSFRSTTEWNEAGRPHCLVKHWEKEVFGQHIMIMEDAAYGKHSFLLIADESATEPTYSFIKFDNGDDRPVFFSTPKIDYALQILDLESYPYQVKVSYLTEI